MKRKKSYQARTSRLISKIRNIKKLKSNETIIISEKFIPKPYRELLDEVYIKPIRSVLIVDDEFPTLEKYLDGTADANEANIDRLKKMVSECRHPDRKWLVDVHDGSELDLGRTRDNLAHLHQSDLLILDYHLDGNQDNKKSINIIKTLANNEHSNIVIVYTHGYTSTAGGDLKNVGLEIAASLTKEPDSFEKLLLSIPKKLSDWEDDEDDITKNLLDSISTSSLLKILNSQDSKWDSIKKLPELSKFSEIISARQKIKKTTLNDVAEWIIAHKTSKINTSLSKLNFGRVNFSTENQIWIKTDKLFITVIGKGVEPKNIHNELLDSLVNWSPSPHKLLMTKIRSELENLGSYTETRILEKKYIQAGWLDRMIKSNSLERPWRIRETASRHWEEMASATQGNIQIFARNVFSYLPDAGEKTLEYIKSHTGVDIEKDKVHVNSHLNCHVCSKEIEGHHLMPGHVLKIPKIDGGFEFWLCLSPACDLVPGQSQRWGDKKSTHLMPFKAVLLHEVPNIDNALKDATSNNIVFMNIASEIRAFRFVPKIGDNPQWEQMFAHENGNIHDGSLRLKISRISVDAKGIKSKIVISPIIAQLRYEYALNLLQRFGSSLSRVGLDFVHHQ